MRYTFSCDCSSVNRYLYLFVYINISEQPNAVKLLKKFILNIIREESKFKKLQRVELKILEIWKIFPNCESFVTVTHLTYLMDGWDISRRIIVREMLSTRHLVHKIILINAVYYELSFVQIIGRDIIEFLQPKDMRIILFIAHHKRRCLMR